VKKGRVQRQLLWRSTPNPAVFARRCMGGASTPVSHMSRRIASFSVSLGSLAPLCESVNIFGSAKRIKGWIGAEFHAYPGHAGGDLDQSASGAMEHRHTARNLVAESAHAAPRRLLARLQSCAVRYENGSHHPHHRRALRLHAPTLSQDGSRVLFSRFTPATSLTFSSSRLPQYVNNADHTYRMSEDIG
jgi:hypothetical protein